MAPTLDSSSGPDLGTHGPAIGPILGRFGRFVDEISRHPVLGRYLKKSWEKGQTLKLYYK